MIRTHTFRQSNVRELSLLRTLCVCGLLLVPALLRSQQTMPRSMRTALSADTLRLDSLSVVPGSLLINGLPPDSAGFRLMAPEGLLIRTGTAPADTAELTFRVYEMNFTQPFFLKDKKLMDNVPTKPLNVYKAGDGGGMRAVFSDDIAKTGSLSRAIQVGNNRDLSVTSAFNLRLNGRLNERFSVIASVSDANIPVQPSGTTGRLQDFDQVYIRVFDERQAIQAGDFQIKSTNHHFSRYFKRAQGLWYETLHDPKRPDLLRVSVSASLSKGKFARNVIQGVESVQGPYRLTGANGEQLIIIMAGTERIYIDGELMQRGEESDYVIDYNSSELTFTPNRPITKDRRIVAEFQYSDKNYARSMYIAQLEKKTEKWDVYLDAYSEQDLRNQPLQADLGPGARSVLANAGDNPLLAVVSGADSTGYSPDFVLYALRDSLGYDTVFVYSTNPNEAAWRVNFSNVGAGNGFYVLDQFTPLGRTYRWVAPDTLNGQIVLRGDHMPLVLLPRPVRRQMVSGGLNYRPLPGLTLKGEASLTNTDANTFSKLDNENNLNFGLRGGFSYELKPRPDTKLITEGHHEYNDADFDPVERFRPVEFDRDWNIRNRQLTGPLRLSDLRVRWEKGTGTRLGLGTERLSVGDGFEGWRTSGLVRMKTDHAFVNSNASLLETRGDGDSRFARSKTEAWRNFSFVRLGYADEFENNRITEPDGTFGLRSYRFHDWEVYAAPADSGKVSARLGYRQRMERLPEAGDLAPGTFARQYSLTTAAETERSGTFIATLGYRSLRIWDIESLPAGTAPEQTLLMRFEHRFSAWNNALTINSFYETGSGLQPKREFIYFEVAPGQGNFVWVDHNGNGIKELNEFEQTPFAYEANYIRVYVPSTEYVRAFPLRFTESLNLDLNRAIKSKTLPARIVRKFSFAANYQLERNLSTDIGSRRFNPLAEAPSEALNSESRLSRATVFFQRAHAKFNTSLTHRDAVNRQLLVNGIEARANRAAEHVFRWNFYKQFVLQNMTTIGSQSADSDFLTGRDFNIAGRTIEPEIQWIPEPGRQASVRLSLSDKQNTRGDERTTGTTFGLKAVNTTESKLSITANADLVIIGFTGSDLNGSLRYEMLEGLQPGRNYLWGLDLRKVLRDGLQVNLTYNGRASETAPAVHIGSVEARFFF